MYMLGLLVVAAPVLNSSLYDELTLRHDGAADGMTTETVQTA